MIRILLRQSPSRLIALGFAGLILCGSILLILPCSVQKGVALNYIDALYTAVSAVCVTGLSTVDAGDTFTPLGQFFLGLLIQLGGLGVATVGAGVFLAMGKKVNLKGRTVVKEALNVDSANGLMQLVRKIIAATILIEAVGAVCNFFVFVRRYPLGRAIGVSLFHAVSAFNNAGFDIMGGFQNLIPYRDSVWLNLVTCALIFLGGIGFLVIYEMCRKKLRWKKYSMHARVVLSVSAVLVIIGTVLIKFTEDVTWLGAFFQSISARTAGFSTYSCGTFTKSGLLVMGILMFIGASPGSTGGGIKTTTFFVLMQGIKSAATNQEEEAFKYSIPEGDYKKASVIALLGLGVIAVGSYLMGIFEPGLGFIDIVFEITSAFATVGLSTGITPGLGTDSKLLCILIMYIGRLGPMTIATLWYFSKGKRVRYPEGNLMIG